jgi:hypothetical protein
MSKKPKLRFIMPWGAYGPGDIIDPIFADRDFLVSNGFCEEVVEPVAVRIESAMAIPGEETAAIRTAPPKRRRGRPRKIRPNG